MHIRSVLNLTNMEQFHSVIRPMQWAYILSHIKQSAGRKSAGDFVHLAGKKGEIP